MKVLDQLAPLSQPGTRAEAAAKLATQFGARYFLLFILDHEVNALLPGPGFPQTIPNGKVWQPFLKMAFKGAYTALLPFPVKEEVYPSMGFPVGNDAVAVFIGACPPEDDLLMLKKVLPVVTVVLQLEYKMKVDTTLKEFAQKTSEKAEKLAKALDVVRYNLQQSLNQQEKANKEIRELMKKKDEFMNMASHELKTPLSSIKAYLQIITRHHPEIKQNVLLSSLVEKTSKQTDRMVQLVNDLLDVNKIQSGQLKLTKTAFNINDLIYDCIEHELIQKNSHQIITTGEKNIILYADKTRMEQVITNLISNALKYSPGADKIIIYTGIDENNWFTFHVTDFGIGIPEAAFPYVFDRFFRVSSTAHKFSGLGLGLYISAEIIQRHNGQIGLQSKEGEGSTFWIKLPINGE